MFSRAFSAFVEDNLEAEGRKSEYLSYGSSNPIYRWGVEESERLRPFPEGEERTRINAAFQDFFDTLKTETTPEGNTRLYSEREDVKKDELRFEEYLDKKIAGGELKATANDLMQ